MTFQDGLPRQLSDGNTLGTILGISALGDKIGFYGATAINQPSGAAQTALPESGTSAGAAALTIYTVAASPASIGAVTTSEQTITVTGVLSTDLVVINKPTSQAGLGLLKGRVSAANTVKLTFANITSGVLTPTAAENYIVGTLPGNLQLTAVLTPAAVPALSATEQYFTVPGLAVGLGCEVNKPSEQAGLGVAQARISAANQLAVQFINTTTGVLTPTAGETYEIIAENGLVAASQILEFGIAATNVGVVASTTTSEQTVTEAGIQSTDIAVGIQKPTLQAGLALLTGRVSGAANYKVTYANVTAGTLTPTTTESYQLTVFRPSPAAVASQVTSATLTPGSVGPSTSAEQTFTVTGLVSGQPVGAQPNYNISPTNAVAVTGIRVSAANTLAVTFMNLTAATVTPAAGTWTVTQINQTTPTAGNSVAQLVTPIQTIGNNLMNAMRSALVNLGLISGA